MADSALHRGLLINAPRPDTLRFIPALTASREEVDQRYLDAIRLVRAAGASFNLCPADVCQTPAPTGENGETCPA